MPPTIPLPDGPIVRFPLMFTVALLVLNVPPAMSTFVGLNELPALLLQVQPDVIKMLPPIVILLPRTVTFAAAETELPEPVAVFPVKVTLGAVPSNVRPL